VDLLRFCTELSGHSGINGQEKAGFINQDTGAAGGVDDHGPLFLNHDAGFNGVCEVSPAARAQAGYNSAGPASCARAANTARATATTAGATGATAAAAAPAASTAAGANDEQLPTAARRPVEAVVQSTADARNTDSRLARYVLGLIRRSGCGRLQFDNLCDKCQYRNLGRDSPGIRVIFSGTL